MQQIFASELVLASAGALLLRVFSQLVPAGKSQAKAAKIDHSREINFKLPQSSFSDFKALTWISSLATSSDRNHQLCLLVAGVAPQSFCQSRHQTGCVWEEKFAAKCSAILIPIYVNFVIYGCAFPCTEKKMHRTFGNNSVSFKETHLGKLLLMHLSKRCSTSTNMSCNYS